MMNVLFVRGLVGSALGSLLLSWSASAQAEIEIDTPAAFAWRGTPINVSDGTLDGQMVTDEFVAAGISLNPFAWYSANLLGPGGFLGPAFHNYNPNGPGQSDGFDIEYTEPAINSGFILWGTEGATFTFTTYYQGQVVDTQTWVNPSHDPPHVISFIHEKIDTLSIETDGSFAITDLALTPFSACDLNGDERLGFRDRVAKFAECAADIGGQPGWIRECSRQTVRFARECGLP